MTGTDMPRKRWGVRAVLALIAGATRTTLPPAGGGYRALPREGFPRPGEIGYPPPPPRPSRGAATTASDSVPVILSEAMHVPSGHDPYGKGLADEDCVLSVRTGRCVRDHDCPRESS